MLNMFVAFDVPCVLCTAKCRAWNFTVAGQTNNWRGCIGAVKHVAASACTSAALGSPVPSASAFAFGAMTMSFGILCFHV